MDPEPAAAPLARFEGVEKRYGDLVALSGLDLEIRRGEVLGLVGPNGAGKTTALKILCGLLPPTAGTATVDSHDVRTAPLEARRSFGYVPDGAPLYANLSARDHLRLVGRLHGLAETGLAAEADRLLEALGLGTRAGDPVGDFSRGMRQKTALACAMLPRPPLLILDEPLSGLDAPTTAVIKECLRAWADRGGAVLYTSHLLDVVERVCDRVAILDGGKLIAAGTLSDLRGDRRGDETLEQIFQTLTHSEDPAAAARRILGSV